MINRANLPETAPEGYSSNYAALLDLMRFGPAILTTSELLVMIFHAERSTVNGRSSDRHSKRDAMKGIYSVAHGRWVRGPAGVGKNAWAKANNELVRKGLLERHRCWDWIGANTPTEYAILWPAFAQAVSEWKKRRSDELSLFYLEPLDQKGA